jgi:UDP-N-acetylmuramoyl-tripeptide--D-alanyl-D-alanine ligase
MEHRALQFVLEASGARLVQGDASARVERVITDSRLAREGDLFVALAGDRFDGHDFVAAAARAGAVAVMIRTGTAVPADLGCGVLAVPDTRAALGRLAAQYRAGLDLMMVAVAGSNGKTTTKQVLASVVQQRFRSHWSPASYNNDVGVPLTLLGLDRHHQVGVVEAGTNHPGELAGLLSMIRPGWGVMSSIGREHLEYFRDLDGVIAEESELARCLPEGGRLFLPGDLPAAEAMASCTRAELVRVGYGAANEWRLGEARFEGGGMFFEVTTERGEFSGGYRVNLVGRHQVLNAVLAMAVGAELGMNRDEVGRGLEQCKGAPRRMQLWEEHGIQVLDDSYNANADSTLAALQTLIDLPCQGRRVAVLGDMAELGDSSESAHAEVGRRAAELGIDQLIAVGSMAGTMGAAARAAGLHRVVELASTEAAAHAVRRLVRRGDLVLVKASRATRLEQVSEALRTTE